MLAGTCHQLPTEDQNCVEEVRMFSVLGLNVNLSFSFAFIPI